jgi:hypothetical protein
MFGFDMPSALICPARFRTPDRHDVVGGVVILPYMSYLMCNIITIAQAKTSSTLPPEEQECSKRRSELCLPN